MSRAQFTIADILKAANVELGRVSNGERYFRCVLTGHEDRHPSAHFNVTTDQWHCPVCGRGGGKYTLIAIIAGCADDDRSSIDKWVDQHGLISRNGARERHIVATYSYRDENGTLL